MHFTNKSILKRVDGFKESRGNHEGYI